jgi:branched-chain amino acid transport system ATP-binding protein
LAILLELDGVEASYGAAKALHGVSLAVGEGQVVAVLGANGAGKTTTLRAVSGTVRRSGEIVFAGRRITRRSPESIARLGVAHVPEGRGTFAELSVRDNLRLGAHTRRASEAKAAYERVLALFPWMRERSGQNAGSLSGGEQQMLAVGRALMQRPRLLLLDEPSLGLAPIVVRGIFELIRKLNADEGIAVLLVEQNARLALGTAHEACVLEVGRVVLRGPSEQLQRDESVRTSYLGY